MTERIVRLSSGVHFAAGADEDLLAAAQRAHWLVRYGCRNGNCRACAATLLEGAVLQDGQRIEAAAPAPTVLLCLCRALTDLRIALPGDPLHGSRAQARRHYSRIENISRGPAPGETALDIELPAGRIAPLHAGQYMLLEHGDELLRGDIDVALSSGRDVRLLCAGAPDFSGQSHVAAMGPLGYCYAVRATDAILLLRDPARQRQAALLQQALPHAQLLDATQFDRLATATHFATVLACARDAEQAVQWYRALLDAGVSFDEFRADDTILHRWSVWRQDDNGNRFAMHDALSEDAARRCVADYEARGHKQLYWAEPMSPRPQPTESGGTE